MSRLIHLCVDVRGALKNPKIFRGNLIDDNGKPVYDVKEIRRLLRHELDLGHEVLPTCGCDNFDYKNGCLGHEVEDGGDS